DEPPRVIDIRELQGVQRTQHLGGIGALHFVRIRDWTLQNHGPCCRHNHHHDQQDDSRPDGAERLPKLAAQMIRSSHNDSRCSAAHKGTFRTKVSFLRNSLEASGLGTMPNFMTGRDLGYMAHVSSGRPGIWRYRRRNSVLAVTFRGDACTTGPRTDILQLTSGEQWQTGALSTR